MDNGDTVSLWAVLTAILIPLMAGGFWLLWARIDGMRTDIKDLWEALNSTREKQRVGDVEAERRFAKADDIRDLKDDLHKRLDRIEDLIQGRATAR